MNASDTDLGMVTKSDIIDPIVADAAFALKSGETSAPVKGRFGTALLQVGKIEPGEEKTYEQMATEIKKRDCRESRQELKSELCATRLKMNGPPAQRSPRPQRNSV